MSEQKMNDVRKEVSYVIRPVYLNAIRTLLDNPDSAYNKSEFAEACGTSRDALYSYWDVIESTLVKATENGWMLDKESDNIDFENRTIYLSVTDETEMKGIRPVFRKALVELFSEENLEKNYDKRYNLTKLSNLADVSRDALHNYKEILFGNFVEKESDRIFVLKQDSEYLDVENRRLKVEID